MKMFKPVLVILLLAITNFAWSEELEENDPLKGLIECSMSSTLMCSIH